MHPKNTMDPADQSSVSLRLFRSGLVLGLLGLFVAGIALTGRIDSPEEQANAFYLAPFYGLPLAAAVFCLTLCFCYRWTKLHRLRFALLLSGVALFIIWRLSVYHAHYPDRIFQSLKQRGLIQQ
jgi:uncharacterized BrkB/YihY/UPF0761 family membrane protein